MDCCWFSNGRCGLESPDIVLKCEGRCKEYRMSKEKRVWDDKFGLIEVDEINNKMDEAAERDRAANEYKKVIEGIGKDAEIVTNEKGGKQSKAVMAMHLVDPNFLEDFICKEGYSDVIDWIAEFMRTGIISCLLSAVEAIGNLLDKDPLIEIAKVLQYGATRYQANNWRLIPQEEHINHALIHYYAYSKGDTQDDHLEHCACRLMMAYATKKSENFNFKEYKSKG